MNKRIHVFSARDIHGRVRRLADWHEQVLLIVNVASKCGFTPQYHALQTLHAKHAARGFSVLGFPCDQFAHQEPGDATEIVALCSMRYGVSFPLFEKICVNGKDAHPLYAWLRAQVPGMFGTTAIKWNFTKFLIDRSGQPVRRYAPVTAPARIEADILALLDD